MRVCLWLCRPVHPDDCFARDPVCRSCLGSKLGLAQLIFPRHIVSLSIDIELADDTSPSIDIGDGYFRPSVFYDAVKTRAQETGQKGLPAKA